MIDGTLRDRVLVYALLCLSSISRDVSQCRFDRQ
uniref:Receptor homology region transmembrane domain-and RING domain-containing protein 2 n=1 Tax=Rhizophora mucronata TaxID=61149 RepID=A0A2P2J1Q2_RHIMU